MMMRIMAMFLFVAALAGCGPPMHVIMRDPGTGRSVYISHYGYGTGMAGSAAMLTAAAQQRRAVEAARAMGYTEMYDTRGRRIGGK